MRYLLLIALATALVCGGCSNVLSIVDGGADSDTDTDSDSDTDTDTDTDIASYWDWHQSEIPYEIYDEFSDFRIWAAAVDDVTICFDGETSVIGLAEFDGASLTVSTLPSGIGEFWCDGVGGNGTDVWAWGYINLPGHDHRVLRRDGEAWVEGTVVEGFGDCVSAPESCRIGMMFADGAGTPRAVGESITDWGPPIVGERVLWERQAATESWVIDTETVFPAFDIMRGLFFVLGGSSTVWGGDMDDDWMVLEVGAGIVDLGYPQSERIEWLDRDGSGGLVSTNGCDLLRYNGAAWNVETGIPCDPCLWDTCWKTGAVDADGNVYLAGGIGGFGDSGPDQWRLHQWDGENLKAILKPCSGEDPYCGISDVTVVENRVYAVGKHEHIGLLLWADIP